MERRRRRPRLTALPLEAPRRICRSHRVRTPCSCLKMTIIFRPRLCKASILETASTRTTCLMPAIVAAQEPSPKQPAPRLWLETEHRACDYQSQQLNYHRFPTSRPLVALISPLKTSILVKPGPREMQLLKLTAPVHWKSQLGISSMPSRK